MQSQFFPESKNSDKVEELLYQALKIDMDRDDAEKKLKQWIEEDKSRLSAKTRESQTLLHLAALHGFGDEIWKKYVLITKLLERNVDVSVLDENDLLPFTYALINYDPTAPVYETMLRKLAEVKVDDAIFKENMLAALPIIARKIPNGKYEIEECIGKLRLGLELVDQRKGITAENRRTIIDYSLLAATSKNNDIAVAFLLEQIKDTNKITDYEIACLEKAIAKNNLNIVNLFLSKFTDADVKKHINKVVSYIALRKNNINMLISCILGEDKCKLLADRMKQIYSHPFPNSFIASLVAAKNKFGDKEIQTLLFDLLQRTELKDLPWQFGVEIDLISLRKGLLQESKESQRSLEDVVRDFSQRKFPLEEKEILNLQEQYRMMSRHVDELAFIDTEKLKEELMMCRQNIVFHDQIDLAVKTRSLAILREIIWRMYRIKLNTTQVFNILAMVTGPAHRVAQIHTGEGKSTIIACVAAWCSFMFGEKVDVFTSSGDLAVRDVEHFEPLFKFLDLKVMHNTRGREKAEIPLDDGVNLKNADIVFGRFEDFAADYLEYELGKRKDVRPFTHVIYDEFDALFKKQSLYVGYTNPACFREFVIEIDSFMKTAVEKTASILEKQLKAKFNLDFPLSYLQEWITAYNSLNQFRYDINYVVQDGKIIPVDCYGSGELLHQTRHFKAACFLELKHGLELHSDNLRHVMLSPDQLLRKYRRLTGLTGTLGTKEQRDKMLKILQINPSSSDTAFYDSPPHLPSQLLIDPQGHVIAAPEEYIQTLIKNINESIQAGRPILLICKTIAESKILFEVLSELRCTVNLYNDIQKELPDDIAREAGKPGSITIATALGGRGFNIPISEKVSAKGGLKTIVTSLDFDLNDQWQKFGRGGRYGQQGSYQYVVSKTDFEKLGIRCDGKTTAAIPVANHF